MFVLLFGRDHSKKQQLCFLSPEKERTGTSML